MPRAAGTVFNVLKPHRLSAALPTAPEEPSRHSSGLRRVAPAWGPTLSRFLPNNRTKELHSQRQLAWQGEAAIAGNEQGTAACLAGRGRRH